LQIVASRSGAARLRPADDDGINVIGDVEGRDREASALPRSKYIVGDRRSYDILAEAVVTDDGTISSN